MIYLDNAATTPVRREVLEATWPLLTTGFGNPSSHHRVGEAAAAALADARATVAAVLGCRPAEVLFTSGGTESDNLAIKGIALAAPRGRHLIISAVEHEAVLESCDYLHRLHGFDVTLLPVDAQGLVDPADLARALTPATTLVSVQYANNEVGTVQPIRDLSTLARVQGVPFHTDAVQAAGWLPLSVADLGVDALSISGHKLGAPQGTGALFLRRRVPLEPVQHGGGQERGNRSGTENVAGAVALATALRLAETERAANAPRVAALRDTFIAEVLGAAPGARLTGHPLQRLPGTASFVFPGTSGEAVLLELEGHGIVCSSGSACAAGSDEPSPTLTAMGLPAEVAQTAVRFTLASSTTGAELSETARAAGLAVATIRGLGRR
ncbi:MULTISPECIES: cysteine desulfurase family protein [unclassified Cryobacterium]|uniref:cysteine desulfurase family protein n=1 Tax=unclassified Cryobacterium TaxID=2649013 RepID=UPI00106ACD19|nr:MULTISPECIES: cysteine desulfurase family protein [unclassified Cryobacterium]TFB94864.1 cysteine desulfurase [Cryobacterium sp. MDB2-A-1]TFC06591.1 cysteine desulfurase [Cryobacterium sp. MDB2-33-2]TFC15755.1 cysteine desulfurase [Cryobacterium sp. MDB2-A-2]TFC16929.1 cysteine desulfurase [Cryobacterium sp. MDB2-10]